ncbi:MAG TPA: respiratory nitrate reductase subunit gamma [Clostridia bacterium]|nr:respiratory nitrate reductase subunit gamma [Clostridia bacterium]
MSLVIFVYATFALFFAGNALRIIRMLRMPTHLRWELYPIPHGSRRQQSYGGSYFEESDWWTKPAESSHGSELLYMLEEALLLKGVWKHHRVLWPCSWLLHVGLYSLLLSVGLAATAAVAIRTMSNYATLVQLVHALSWLAFSAGLAGALGLIALRFFSSRLRPYTSRGTFLNLAVIAAIFGTGLASIILDPASLNSMIALAGACLFLNPAPQIAAISVVHVVCVAAFLAYFPFTHMTHMYMKYFTYHDVRWDDAPSASNPRIAESMARNLAQPVSWSAPHIAGNKTSGSSRSRNWMDVASAQGGDSDRNA